jgi:hypothetical protein
MSNRKTQSITPNTPEAGSPVTDYRHTAQFYQHDVDWANRLILGDSLAVKMIDPRGMR